MADAGARQTDSMVLQLAMRERVDRRVAASGTLTLPCVPAMLDSYMATFATLFETLGRPFSADDLARLRVIVDKHIAMGWRASPFSRLVFEYRSRPFPEPGLTYDVSTRVMTIDDEYGDWVATREPPLFGGHPDAKVLAAAAALGPPATVPVLDVGAGTGRNTLPLARLGHPTGAVELSAPLAEVLRAAVAAERLEVDVIHGDVLDPACAIRPGYKLVVLAEVVASHFRDLDQVRRLFTRMCDVLAPGGLLLLSIFLAADGYQPDAIARELSQVFWSCLFTRHEIAAAMDGLPLELVGDESVHDYERDHLPAEAWPPTGWFQAWTQGYDLFGLAQAKPPMELRWITCRRSGA